MIKTGRKDKINLLRALAVIAALPPISHANAQSNEADCGELALRGSIGVELRGFALHPSYAEQDPHRVQGSVVATGKLSWQSTAKDVAIDVAPFLRVDSADDERTHFDLREAALNIYGPDVDLRVGVSKVYWGVTESRKIVDIVNQTDLVEEPRGDEKLGQPMVMLRAHLDDVEASVLLLPIFRQRTFPGKDGRLRAALPVDTELAEFESPAKENRLDVAGRLKARFGEVDIGLSYFNGTSREPRFEIGGVSLIPVYDVIDQVGLDVQATLGATLLKLEAITRDGHRGPDARRFSAVVAGVEHTISQFAQTTWDLGLIAELIWDDRPVSAPPTIYDKDIFLGARMAFNDTGDSSALFGVLYDPGKSSAYATLEGSTRIDDTLRLEIDGALVLHSGSLDAVLQQIRDDSFVSLSLIKYL